MTTKQFADHLHSLGYSYGFFMELVTMWQRVEDCKEGEEPPMRVIGNNFDMNQETLIATIAVKSGDPDDPAYKAMQPKLQTINNPLEAWAIFWQTVDGNVRRWIGNHLEKRGLDRYTGQKKITPPILTQLPSRPGAKCDDCQHGQNGTATCPERFNKGRCANGIPINPTKEE